MTDATQFYQIVIAQSGQFITALENMLLISDRIGADSALSTAAAAAANARGRTDLTAASFDNLKMVIDLLQTVLNATNGNNIPVTINTGGTAKLAFYMIV